ncbi:MAG: hypothetical protein A3J74_08660 [Elusimicrobia bacterium RIFCSPHIGHO2_02_FULL_57_9]|nr:MAG: hypothetical protein A3J74_08660 [Elusimicrobia bacterium RIFCSPHIGHO2_02_FULL_57_9]
MGLASLFGFKRTKPLILHVDDSVLVLGNFNAMLVQLGCDVISVLGGEECLKAAAKKMPDLILIDAMMPEMDGFQTTSVLRLNAKTRDIPIIMVTGADRVKDVDKAIESGINGTLLKPVSMDRLEAKLREFIKLPPKQ